MASTTAICIALSLLQYNSQFVSIIESNAVQINIAIVQPIVFCDLFILFIYLFGVLNLRHFRRIDMQPKGP